MYPQSQNFNIAQNDTDLYLRVEHDRGWEVIGTGFSPMAWENAGFPTTLTVKYQQFLPFMLISAICMLGFSASIGAGQPVCF